MEKRTLLAIALSLLIVSGWSVMASRLYPVANKEVSSISPNAVAPAPKPIEPIAIPEPSPSSVSSVSAYKREVLFLDNEGAIQEAIFPEYQNYKFILHDAFLLGENRRFSPVEASASNPRFISEDQEKRITKEFTFLDNYIIELRVDIHNMSNLPLNIDYPLSLGQLRFDGQQHHMYQDVTAVTQDKTVRLNPRKESVVTDVKFLGLRDRYFCAIIEPVSGRYAAFTRKLSKNTFQVGLQPLDMVVPAGGSTSLLFHIYLGPQELNIINSLQPKWAAVIHYGTFGVISELLLWILGLIYRVVSNWGWAIVILSILIYFMLYPLSIKQIRSMKAMQALKPMIDELNKKYKDNPQRLNREIMQLYRDHKVNPLGGCLPMVLQLPIFFALYQAIMRSIALKGAHFLWIKDLSEPDRLFILPNTLPVLGNEVNILPILMAIGMFIQQKMSSKAMGAGSAEQQKMMMILMPVIFGVIFYHMPAALVLYWFINSSLMLIFQIRAGYTK